MAFSLHFSFNEKDIFSTNSSEQTASNKFLISYSFATISKLVDTVIGVPTSYLLGATYLQFYKLA